MPKVYRMLIGSPSFEKGYDASAYLAEVVQGMWAPFGMRMRPEAVQPERQNGSIYVFSRTPFGPDSPVSFKTAVSPDKLVEEAFQDHPGWPYHWILSDIDYDPDKGGALGGVLALRKMKDLRVTEGPAAPVTALFTPEKRLKAVQGKKAFADALKVVNYVASPVLEQVDYSMQNVTGQVIARHYLDTNPDLLLKGLAAFEKPLPAVA